jgi:hypothetical protein
MLGFTRLLPIKDEIPHSSKGKAMIKYTGLGCLEPFLLMGIFFASLAIASIFIGGERYFVEILAAVGLMVLLSPLHWLFGRRINSEWTPSGRQWDNQHTFMDVPLQHGYVFQLLIALVVASIVVGQQTSPLYGWLLLGGGVAGTVVGLGVWLRVVGRRAERLSTARRRGPAGAARKRE